MRLPRSSRPVLPSSANTTTRRWDSVLARTTGRTLGRLTDLYVAPEHRRRGAAAALTAAAVTALRERGAEHVNLEVMASNAGARAVYQRWGFQENVVTMVAPAAELEQRLQPGRHSVSFASMHVQTDDRPAVEQGGCAVCPAGRIEGKSRRGAAERLDDRVRRGRRPGPRPVLLRYARELSERMGIIVVAFSLELDEDGCESLRWIVAGSSTNTSRFRSSTVHSRPAT